MINCVNEKLSNLSFGDSHSVCSLANFNFDQCRCIRPNRLLVDESIICNYEESLETLKSKYSNPSLICQATHCVDTDFSTAAPISDHILNSAYPFQNSPICRARLINRNKLTSNNAKKQKYAIVIQIEVDFECESGDSIYFICPNTDEEVTWLLRRLGYFNTSMHTLQAFDFTAANKKRPPNTAHLPKIASMFQVFKHCLDIRRIFSKELIRYLASCCAMAEEGKILAWLTERENAEKFESLILVPRLSLLDILHAFPSCAPSAVILIGLLPRLLPRPLSIASKTIDAHGRHTFLYSLVEIQNGCGRFYAREGICTGFLNNLVLDSQIYVYWKKPSNFRIKLNGSSTKLLIGPGVGVAPFVSYLENIETSGLKPAPVTWLFFGCRKKDDDFILKESFEKWVKKGAISRLLVSFSQEEKETKYVQHNILKYGEEIAQMLIENNQLFIYVCGDAKNMIKDVEAAFERILQQFYGLTPEDAKQRLKQMKSHGQYVEEAWI